jgi:hypothetical protein
VWGIMTVVHSGSRSTEGSARAGRIRASLNRGWMAPGCAGRHRRISGKAQTSVVREVRMSDRTLSESEGRWILN